MLPEIFSSLQKYIGQFNQLKYNLKRNRYQTASEFFTHLNELMQLPPIALSRIEEEFYNQFAMLYHVLDSKVNDASSARAYLNPSDSHEAIKRWMRIGVPYFIRVIHKIQSRNTHKGHTPNDQSPKSEVLKRIEKATEESFDSSMAEKLSLDDSVTEEEYKKFLTTGKVPTKTMRLVIHRPEGEILDVGDRVPSEVGWLKIEKRIGKGVFGRVYLATDQQGTSYAVKFIEPRHTKSPEFIERFLLEFNIQKYLNECPFTVKIHGRRVPNRSVRFEYIDEESKRNCEYLRTPYVVMGYIEGSRNILSAIPILTGEALGIETKEPKNGREHRSLLLENPGLRKAILKYAGSVGEQVADLLVCLSTGKSEFIKVPNSVYGMSEPGYRSPQAEVNIKTMIIHRDLKPHNILLRFHKRPVELVRDNKTILKTRFTVAVSDFGLAKPMVSRLNLTGIGEVLGARFYMAPEQISASGLDTKVDVFALGSSICHLVFGEPLYAELWRKAEKCSPKLRDMIYYNEIKKGNVTIRSQFKEWNQLLKGEDDFLEILEKSAHPEHNQRYTCIELRNALRDYNQRHR